MSTVKNQYGREIDLDAAATIMDIELTNSHDLDAADNDQEWFEIYCRVHEEKYGEEFELNKENGQW